MNVIKIVKTITSSYLPELQKLIIMRILSFIIYIAKYSAAG